jgi:hypothetical protein
MATELTDPLLVLLRRHEAANDAFDKAAARDAPEAEKEHLFSACTRTMEAIADRAPAATTADGAIAALNHLLADDGLWPGAPNYYPAELFWRHLITAARDFISRKAQN